MTGILSKSRVPNGWFRLEGWRDNESNRPKRMSWITLLWAGLLAAGLPLLIHRLQRQGTLRLPISSISIIRSGRDRARRRWSRDRSVLLWIRMAALGSLALALSTVVPAERSERVDPEETESSTRLSVDSVPEGGVSTPLLSSRLVAGLAVEPETTYPLTTAIRLLAQSMDLELDPSPPDHPQLWSRQRQLNGEEQKLEVWVQQGWSEDRSESGSRLEWIRSGGHLVVTLDAGTSLIGLNRWLSSAGLSVRTEPAQQGDALSAVGLSRWIGEDLFGRTVDAPRIDLPDRSPEIIIQEASDDDVLLRTQAGDALVWRQSLGAGWITLSTLEWRDDRQGWIYHPLFPLILRGLLALPESGVEVQAMSAGSDTLTTRNELPAEPVRPDSGNPQRGSIWMVWAGLGLVLLLTESIAGRYLTGRRSTRPVRSSD